MSQLVNGYDEKQHDQFEEMSRRYADRHDKPEQRVNIKFF